MEITFDTANKTDVLRVKKIIDFIIEDEEKTIVLSGRPISDLELTARASNCLRGTGIETVADLIIKTEIELLKTPNCGRNTISEIKGVLGARGLYLGTVL